MGRVISQRRFQEEALEAHNKYRKAHGVQPVQHDPKLSELAVEWAEHLASRNLFKYKNDKYDNEPLGESILRAKALYIGGDLITELLYKEKKNYSFDGKFTANTGHFTQIVWKSTTRVGFGYAVTETGQFYSVFNYYPAGNYKNEFHLNVFPSQIIQTKKTNGKTDNGVAPLEYYNDCGDVGDSVKENMSNKMISSLKSFQAKFINEALTAHNQFRMRHCVPALVHNPQLSRLAQAHSDHCASISKLVHSNNKLDEKKLGENLAFFMNTKPDFASSNLGESCTKQWYDEIAYHNFNADYQPGSGHFTQVVWKNSKEVGFGITRVNDEFYMTAHYNPPGNFIGTFTKNVTKPI